MNMKKRLLAMMSAAAMLLSAAPLSAIAEDSEPALHEQFEENGIYYVYEGDEIGWSASIYNTETPDCVIPEQIKGYPVTKVYFAHTNSSVVSLTLPSTVKAFDFMYCSKLQEFNVSEQNEVFSSLDGVLYDKSGETLVYYPPARDAASFTVPEGVQTIGECAFYECDNLTEVILPESLEVIDTGAFCEMSNLTELTIPSQVHRVETQYFDSALETVTLCCDDRSLLWDDEFLGWEYTMMFHEFQGFASVYVPDELLGTYRDIFGVTMNKGTIEVLPVSEKPGAEDTEFNEESFFVVVGTYGQENYTQLRYFGENSAEKVVWADAPEGLDYGDVLVAEGEVSMTRVASSPDDPTNRMAYYYDLDEGTKLTKVGNCADIMEQRELTVTSKGYDGSSHWSVRFKDKDGNEFYYGLNTFASSLGVNVVSFEVGDVLPFAFYNGNVVIPLAKTESIDVPGDINGDGVFSIADVVLLQRWLVAAPDCDIVNWKAADLCEDGRLDVFDLVLMRKALIKKLSETDQNVDVAFSLHSVTEIRDNFDEHTVWKGYVANSEAELNDIIIENEGASSQDISSDGIDKDFFSDRALVVIYSRSGAGNQYSIIDDMTINGNELAVSTTTKSSMIPTPDMLYRRYIFSIDKESARNIGSFSFDDTSSSYKYEEHNAVSEWYKEWASGSFS